MHKLDEFEEINVINDFVLRVFSGYAAVCGANLQICGLKHVSHPIDLNEEFAIIHQVHRIFGLPFKDRLPLVSNVRR